MPTFKLNKYRLFRKLLIIFAVMMVLLLVLLLAASSVSAHDEHEETSRTEKVVSWAGLIVVCGAVVGRFYLARGDDSDETEPDSEQ